MSNFCKTIRKIYQPMVSMDGDFYIGHFIMPSPSIVGWSVGNHTFSIGMFHSNFEAADLYFNSFLCKIHKLRLAKKEYDFHGDLM